MTELIKSVLLSAYVEDMYQLQGDTCMVYVTLCLYYCEKFKINCIKLASKNKKIYKIPIQLKFFFPVSFDFKSLLSWSFQTILNAS